MRQIDGSDEIVLNGFTGPRLAGTRPVDVAAWRTVRAADVRDAIGIGDGRDEREADLAQLAPVAVQEVREVLDIEGHDAAGLAEDRQLLRETQVEGRDPRAAVGVARHDPAAPLLESLLLDVGVHVRGELRGGGAFGAEVARGSAARDDAKFRCRAGAFEDHVAVRHVEEVALARTLARVAPDRRAGTERVAVRTARAPLADERDARLVIADERLGPLERAIEPLLDLVVRGLEARVVRVRDRDVVPVRRRGRAGTRVDVPDVLVAVAEVGIEAARCHAPGLARLDREDPVLALAGVGEQEVLQERVGAPIGTRRIDRPAVRRRADLLQPDVPPEHLVVDP